MVRNLKIISGGQTGVDRAALDAAMKHGLECGGWCPAGRLDEFGRIPDCYPVKELPAGSFAERTRQNVRDSEGTVVIYRQKLRGGTEQTVRFCRAEQCPHRLLDAAALSTTRAATIIIKFLRAEKISVLNIAGPRESEWPQGYDFTFAILDLCLAEIA